VLESRTALYASERYRSEFRQSLEKLLRPANSVFLLPWLHSPSALAFQVCTDAVHLCMGWKSASQFNTNRRHKAKSLVNARCRLHWDSPRIVLREGRCVGSDIEGGESEGAFVSETGQIPVNK
jgi:hypothetical protein